jgi:hypothetical protein
LRTGDIVTVADRGDQEFIVITSTEHTAWVRQWPITDAPPAETVLRSHITIKSRQGNE